MLHQCTMQLCKEIGIFQICEKFEKVIAQILIKFDRNFLKRLLLGQEMLKVYPENKKFAY